MRTIIAITIGIAGVCVAGYAFAADDVKVESAVGKVTVYTDRAEVTRAAEVELRTGEHRLRFEPLPPTLVPDSVRASGAGSANVTLGAVEIDRKWQPERQAGRAQQLQKEIEALEYRLRELDAEQRTVLEQAGFISSVEKYSAETVSKSLAMSPEMPLDLGEIIAFVASRRDALTTRQLAIEKDNRQINRQLEALRNELGQLGNAGTQESVAAVVDVNVEAPGQLRLELTYVVPEASWRPIYDARLAENQKTVELEYNAVVVQKTGEDWPNVHLRLSTAQPQIGARIPELEPLRVAFARPETRARLGIATRRLEEAPEEPEKAPGLAEDVRMYADISGDLAKVRTAAVETKGISVLFDVPGREDIPSDGNEHKTTISSATFSVEPEHVAVPKLSPHVFVKCEILNDTDLALLPGKVNSYVGGNLVGASQLDAVAPQETFELGFGVDQSLKVERDELRDVRGRSGIFGRYRRVARGYEFTVKNNRPDPAGLTVIDQIPVSRNEDVKVSVTRSTAPPTKETEDGLLEWKVSLKPSEEKNFQFGYEVEYPRSMHLVGLD
jgi:uncharacterized protein (TIGR02231 family)